MPCPGGGGGWPAKHCLSDCYSSVKLRKTGPLATRAKGSRGVPVWITCVCWIYLDRWRVQGTKPALSLQKDSKKMTSLLAPADFSHTAGEYFICVSIGFRPGAEECCDCSCLPAPARGQGSVELPLGWEKDSTMTACTCQPQPGHG